MSNLRKKILTIADNDTHIYIVSGSETGKELLCGNYINYGTANVYGKGVDFLTYIDDGEGNKIFDSIPIGSLPQIVDVGVGGAIIAVPTLFDADTTFLVNCKVLKV